MKYIIFENRYPVIFPEFLTHAYVAGLCARGGIGKPTSAGFIRMSREMNPMNTKLFPYGSSLSLNLTSEPGDSGIINNALDQ